MAYLDPKGEGDNSMLRKAAGIAKASKVGRCGTRVIWRKLDCLNPNPQSMKILHPPERRL